MTYCKMTITFNFFFFYTLYVYVRIHTPIHIFVYVCVCYRSKRKLTVLSSLFIFFQSPSGINHSLASVISDPGEEYTEILQRIAHIQEEKWSLEEKVITSHCLGFCKMFVYKINVEIKEKGF